MPRPDVPILYLIASLGHGKKLPAIAKAVREVAPSSKLALLVQLRDKETPARQVYEAAASWAQTLKPLEVPLLLNERVDIALASGAAGAHLSKESFSIAEARSLLPKGILAYSAHSPEEAVEAASHGADLVTLSPIFDSPGKGTPIGLKAVRKTATGIGKAKLIALGGVTEENAPKTMEAGAHGIALIRSVLGAPAPPQAAAKIARLILESGNG